jgi:hypothetical protein
MLHDGTGVFSWTVRLQYVSAHGDGEDATHEDDEDDEDEWESEDDGDETEGDGDEHPIPKRAQSGRPDNIVRLLCKWLPSEGALLSLPLPLLKQYGVWSGVTTDPSQFARWLAEEETSDACAQPPGELVHAYTREVDGQSTSLAVYTAVPAASPTIADMMSRLQFLVVLFIETGSRIDLDDDCWRTFVTYMECKLPGQRSSWKVVGCVSYSLFRSCYVSDSGRQVCHHLWLLPLSGQSPLSRFASARLGKVCATRVCRHDLIFCLCMTAPVSAAGPWRGAAAGDLFVLQGMFTAASSAPVLTSWSAKNDGSVFDVTVETPSDEFQMMRDTLDLALLWADPEFKCVSSLPSSGVP